jgi:hypothetical protein
VAVLVVGLSAAAAAGREAASGGPPGDFARYHHAGRLVAEGRADRLYRAGRPAAPGDEADPAERDPALEFKYLPAFAVLMAPLGRLDLRSASLVWAAWNGALVALLFLAAWRACAGGLPAAWMAVPVVLLANLVNANVKLGQLNPTAIVPATLALLLLSRGRDAAAGLLAAFGAVVKFMPAACAVWFAWKRRWRALGALVLGVALLGWGLPAAVLGPARATELTREYFSLRADTYTSAEPDDVPGHSIKSFVYRVLGGSLHRSGPGGEGPDVTLVVLPGPALFAIVLLLDLLVLAAVLFAARGPLRPPGDRRGALEAGAFLAALPLVSPEARSPHFLYLALALTALTYSFVDLLRPRAPASGGPLARALAAVRAAPRSLRVALVLSLVGAVLLNTSPRTFLPRGLASSFLSAVCSLGWAALCFLLATLVHLRVRRAAPA